MLSKYLGSLLAVAFCIIILPTARVYPAIQIEAIFNSSIIYAFVKKSIVDQNSSNRCINELIWVCLLYLGLALILSIVFYWLKFKTKSGMLFLLLFLATQFYLLQTPFFIFSVGTLYNCRIDGQTIMALMDSSPHVSYMMILFGVIYDFRNKIK